MSGAAKTDQLRLGFLETLEVDGRGHVGGLLITNQHGRPLEFQCTTPVKPNRTRKFFTVKLCDRGCGRTDRRNSAGTSFHQA